MTFYSKDQNMLKTFSRLVVVLALVSLAGCGPSETGPAKAAPEMTPEAKEAMKKAMEGQGASGPEYLKKMQEQQQNKTN